MIDLIFTLDYEIYGNGSGSLGPLVHEPAARLIDVFRRRNVRLVAFVEAAELERISSAGSDPSIGAVEQQIREMHRDGFEIALHLHPQWCGATYENGTWTLDYREYNLCTLPRERIADIVDRAIGYLRRVLDEPAFTPLAFRAGNWLFQPAETAAGVLAERGVRIDSSVFKGGLQRRHGLDYRRAARNGFWWRFAADATEPAAGPLIEIPVYTEMVPFWRMLTAKRVGLQATGASAGRSVRHRIGRIADYLRPRYPMKLDFCRMTPAELTSAMTRLLQHDRRDPQRLLPVVAIGHTKDLADVATVDRFLQFLADNGVRVSTFADVHPRLASPPAAPPALSLALVTPARNEARFVEATLQAVVAQTVRPVRWVIVSDGSTDGTDEIVTRYAARHEWIELVRLPEGGQRDFASKVRAFDAGYARLSGIDYDVIGNLDADITFDPDYLAFLLGRFVEHPRLGVAGTPFVEAGASRYDYRFTSIEHVSGACQLFRRRCFEEIGGYKPSAVGGVDLVAVLSARMKGWSTRSFVEFTSRHHRPMGTARQHRMMVAFKGGRGDYLLGSHPVWEVCRCLYQMTRPPLVVGGLLRLLGFVSAMLSGRKKLVDADLLRFRRTEQLRRLRRFAAGMVQLQTGPVQQG